MTAHFNQPGSVLEADNSQGPISPFYLFYRLLLLVIINKGEAVVLGL
jgi:hypothetical protein